jgi:hypothetical protein
LKWISTDNPSLAHIVSPVLIKGKALFEYSQIYSAQVNLEAGVSFIRQKNKTPILIKESTFWQPIEIDLKVGLVPKGEISQIETSDPIYIIPVESNYYHWMFDVLPYAIVANNSIQNLTMIANVKMSKFQCESFHENIRIIKSKEVWINLKNVVLPRRRHETGNPTVEIINVLRQYFFKLFEFEKSNNLGKRIYISRKNATRSPENEEEIEKTLTKLGFQILNCEEMSLFAQYDAFRQAEIVIGPHGAGLSNLMFCEADVKVIELIPRDFHNPCYEKLCSIVSLDYRAIPYDGFNSEESIMKFIIDLIS